MVSYPCLPLSHLVDATGVGLSGNWLVTSSAVLQGRVMEQAELRRRARLAIESHKIPNRHPHQLWGVHGVGGPCAICGLPVNQNELEYEVQFAREANPKNRVSGNDHFQVFHVHIHCFWAWDVERTVQQPLS